jgi:HEAT repeat protein
LRAGRVDAIAAAAESRRSLDALVSLTFDPESLIAWRAVEALGVAAERIASDAPEVVRDQLRRLHWLLSEESGGVCWRAPEAMAEIVARRPESFAEYVPIIVTLLVEMAEEDLRQFRAGILWAITRLGRVAAVAAGEVMPAIESALADQDAQVRGMAIRCLGRLGRHAVVAARPSLLSDDGVVELYAEGVLTQVTVAELARSALGG